MRSIAWSMTSVVGLVCVLFLLACAPKEAGQSPLNSHKVDVIEVYFRDFEVVTFTSYSSADLIRNADLKIKLTSPEKMEEFVKSLPTRCDRETRQVERPEDLHALIVFKSSGRIVEEWRYSRFDYAKEPGPLNCRMDDFQRDQVRSAVGNVDR